MASNLVNIFGWARLNAIEDCPQALQGTLCKLRTKDNDLIELPAEAACISLRLRDALLQNGADVEIPVPLRKALLSKVIEYLSYHRDVPFSDIEAPLGGDSLGDCGAQKWDASYVSGDKELVFDLALAASFLDIPGLLVLAGAKLALLVRERASGKLQKDHGYADDAPAGEAEQLQQGFAGARRRLGFGMKDDGDDLAQLAVLLDGLLRAADRGGLLGAGGQGAPLGSWRQAAWRAAALEDWRLLATAPREVAGDRALLEGAVAASHGAALAYAADALKADRDLVLRAVSCNGAALKHAAQELRGDRGFVLEAIKADGAAFAHATSDLREDRSMVLEAARAGSGSALGGAAAALRADRDLVAGATQLDPAAFKHAAEDLRGDPHYALHIAGLSGAALQYMPDRFRADAAIVRAAVANDPSAAVFAHTSRRLELGLKMPWDSDLGYTEISKVEVREDDIAQVTALSRMMTSAEQYRPLQLTKMVFFSGLGTIITNIGQGNYLAANAVLDKMTGYPRPVVECSTLMWGGMGQIGMRLKAFGSQDVLNAAPENLLTIYMARQIQKMVLTRFDVPDWLGGAAMDPQGREAFLAPTAGFGSGGGWTPGEDTAPPSPSPRRAEPGARVGDTSEDAPLGGWPTLLSAPKEVPPKRGAAEREAPDLPIGEGCRVLLSGLQGKKKSGRTGIAVRQLQDSRWKVLMDDGSGHALLRAEYLRGVAAPEGAAAGVGVVEPGDAGEEAAAESEGARAAAAAAAEQKRQSLEEKAKLSRERLAERRAEAKKHEGVPGVCRAARPGWSDFAIQLAVKAMAKVGAGSVPQLRSMIQQDGGGAAELNRLLAAAGEEGFADEFLQALRGQCEKALGA